MKEYSVYNLSNSAAILYIGITNDLANRVAQHRDHPDAESFASRYNLHRLVFVETYPTARQAIAREKQLKGWRREKKIALIEKTNPRWQDLAEHWGREMRFRGQPLKRTP